MVSPELTPTNSCDYTENNVGKAALFGIDGGPSEADIASTANTNVCHTLDVNCICQGSWNQTSFDIAVGNSWPSPAGMCCCRAEGLDCVLNVVGIGPYTPIYCNEMPEVPDANSDHHCEGSCPTHGTVYRRYNDGGWAMKWEGAIRSGGAGSTAYAPGGGSTYFEGTHDEIADNWPYGWWSPTYGWCDGSCEVEGVGACSGHSSYWGRFEE